MKKTRIVNNIAVDTTAGNINEMFHPDLVIEFIDCPDFVESGWTFIDGVWAEPAPIIIPEPEPIPKVPAILTHYQFLNLCQSAGGMTDDMLVASKQDPVLAAMWIKFDVAQDLRVDDPNVLLGLEALHSLGYLPGGAEAILNNWQVN